MKQEHNGRVPVFRSWRRWYTAVLLLLTVEIAALALFSQAFR